MEHIGKGITWFDFWLMIGLSNFGESKITYYNVNSASAEETVSLSEAIIEDLTN